MFLDRLRKRSAISATRKAPRACDRGDRVLADLEQWVEKVQALPDIRWEKVAAVRKALDAGRYDCDVRLEDLLDRRLDQLEMPTRDA